MSNREQKLKQTTHAVYGYLGRYLAGIEDIFTSALVSEMISADMTGDKHFVNPNCIEHCSKSFDKRGRIVISNNFPKTGVTVIPL